MRETVLPINNRCLTFATDTCRRSPGTYKLFSFIHEANTEQPSVRLWQKKRTQMQDGSSKDRFYFLNSIDCYGNLLSKDKHAEKTNTKQKQKMLL